MASTIYRADITVQFVVDRELPEAEIHKRMKLQLDDAMSHFKQTYAVREGQRIGVTFDWFEVTDIEDEESIWGDDE